MIFKVKLSTFKLFADFFKTVSQLHFDIIVQYIENDDFCDTDIINTQQTFINILNGHCFNPMFLKQYKYIFLVLAKHYYNSDINEDMNDAKLYNYSPGDILQLKKLLQKISTLPHTKAELMDVKWVNNNDIEFIFL